MSEAGIHFDFYFHLRTAIEDDPQRGQRTYERVKPEYKQNIDGRADLVLFDTNDDPALVIEAKRPGGAPSRDIDPYAPAVIKQAHGYASQLGTPYFATYNSKRLVLFSTHEQGVPLLDRASKAYDIADVGPFADTLLNEIARLEAEQISWDSLDEAFIKRMRTLHELLTPELETELAAKLDADSEFRESFVEWANAQGVEYDDASARRQVDVRERFAEEGAYLLANKVLFYKILEAAPAYAAEVRPLGIRPAHARADLEERFEEIVANIDFEAVFEHDPIYSEIPLASVGDRINEFIDELDDQDLTQFDSDVIGRIYEGVIPSDRRRELGEYYTPPAICDLIARLTIDEASDRVLDPACGSGGFPVSAYHRKRDLLPEPNGSHDRLLTEIYGIDINRFPAHLTAINLAIQDLSSHTESVDVEVSDFFNVTPDTQRFGRTQAGAGGEEWVSGNVEDALGGFDAVVGNPPYVRGRSIDLDHKDAIREHLDKVDAEWMTRTMDLYGYFITHGTAFLGDGGRLGFIISDRWMDTRYGTDLQRFLLDNFRIEAVIKSNRQMFEDALIGSTVIILEKEPDAQIRDDHITKFVELREAISLDDIVAAVEQDVEGDQMVVTDEYRIVTNQQKALRDIDKWNVFFMAPPIYFDVVHSGQTIELQEVANMHTGKECGSNDFFYRRSEDIEDLGIEQYFSPLLKASGQVSKIRFDEVDAEEWGILDVHHLPEKAFQGSREFGGGKMNQVKQWLAENGHEALLEYIEWGEDNEHHERSQACKKRDIWFVLDDLDEYRPPLAIPDFVWTESRVVQNVAEAVTDRQFHNIDPDHSEDAKVLCGVLNSRLVWLARELEGRHAGGQGMTRSRMVLYEAKQLPIPNPREMSADERERITTALDELIAKEAEMGEDDPLEVKDAEREALDRAVLATLGMEDRADELKQAVSGLVKMREESAGDYTEVLINRTEEKEVIELRGVAQARESATLSDYE